MWRGNAGRSKRTVNVGGGLGWGSGSRYVPTAVLICIVGGLLWLGMRIARLMAGLRRIEISTAAVK